MPVRLQLEGPDLEGLLSRVNEEYGAGARIVEAEKIRRGGIGGFFAREHFEMTVEVDDDPALFSADDVPDTAAGLLGLADSVEDRSVSTSTEAFSNVMRRLVASTGADPTPASPVVDEPDEHARFEAAAFEPLLPTAAVVIPAEPRWDVPPPASPPARAPQPEVINDEHEALAELGLPAAMMPARGTAPLQERLTTTLTTALPTVTEYAGPGDLMVVIGERTAALEVATSLALQWDLAADGVLVIADPAGPATVPAAQAVAGAQTLHAKHAAAHRRGLPLIVAVDERLAIDPPRNASWPAGLRPFLADARRVGVVPASAKPEDITRWAERIGGVDTLAVVDLDGTGSPATVLATGVPVTMLEQRPATAAEWAALLCARLGEST